MVRVGEQGIFLSNTTANKLSPYNLSQFKKTLVLDLNALQSFTETDPIFQEWLATPPNISLFTNDAGYITSFSELDPVYTASSWYSTTNNSTNWNTAYGWGNHASAGYLTSITSGQVITALGYTPYDSTNPSGYITNSSLSSYVPNTRTLTINGTAYDLSADRSWTIATNSGTVTSVAALTLGTTGTDLSSSVATGTTTPIITLNVPTASATNRGALSSTDWSTFNSKFTLPTLTNGSVLFSNGSTITQDNTNLFWDDTNNRLGLGTASPAYKLEINAGSTSGILQQITTSGNDSLLRLSSVSRYVKIGVDNLYGARFDTNAGGFAMPDAGDILPTSNGIVTNLTTNLGRSGIAYGNLFANIANFAGSGTNYFAGNIGIGQTSATARLHIAAGTATASKAPLKFTAGTNLTTPENGAIEFDGTNLYFTTGGVRKTIVLV
jgi:hypothetical protein